MPIAKKRTRKKTEATKSASVSEEPVSAKEIVELSSKIEASEFPETNGDAVTVSKREEIALLAYIYWVQRGCQGGSPEEDWFRAERELSESSGR
jgi:hypothetical protein